MLKKKERLTKEAFDRSFSVGKRRHSPYLQLIYVPGNTFYGAVVVGKKVYPNAVDRNRLRRRVYGVLYRLYKEHDLHGTYILIAKPSIKNLSHKELPHAVHELLQQNMTK